MNWRLLLTVLGIVFISEMGDKTQVTTMLLAGAKPSYVFWVALGSATALICASFLEVIVGSHIIARYVKPSMIKITSGVAFLVLGLLLVAGVLGGAEVDI